MYSINKVIIHSCNTLLLLLDVQVLSTVSLALMPVFTVRNYVISLRKYVSCWQTSGLINSSAGASERRSRVLE